MLASELARRLLETVSLHGDFRVTSYDYEFSNHEEIKVVKVEKEVRCDEHYHSRPTGKTVIALHSIG